MTNPTAITPDTDETELVVLAQKGDEAAFAELMRRNRSTSMRLAVSLLRDREEAEDQVQTSFLKAWQHLANFKLESRFSTWFRTIVRNQSLMRLRSMRQAKFVHLDQAPEDGTPIELAAVEATPEQGWMDAELKTKLGQEMSRLPASMRQVLMLRDVREMNTEEAACELGISEPALKSRLNRARNMLRQRMERHT